MYNSLNLSLSSITKRRPSVSISLPLEKLRVGMYADTCCDVSTTVIIAQHNDATYHDIKKQI